MLKGLRSLDSSARGVLLAMAAANALIFFDQTSVTTALPTLRAELDMTSSEAQWVIGGYLLALAGLMAVAGRVADLFGHRRVFLIGTAIFGVGSLACAAAPSYEFLIGARILQGCGAAFIFPLTLANVTSVVSDARRGWAIGALAAGGTSFLSLGPLLGGVLLQVADWRAIFLVNLPVIAYVIVATRRNLPESERQADVVIDWLGLMLLVSGLTALMVGLLSLDSWGAGSPLSVTTLGGSLLILAGFVARELKAPAPIVNVRFLRMPIVAGSLFSLVAIQFCVLGLTVYLLVYLQLGLGLDPLTAGLWFLPTVIGSPLLSPRTGRLADRYGAHWLVAGGLVLAAVSLAAIAVLAPGGDPLPMMIAFLAFGIARPFVFTPAGSGPVKVIPSSARGVACSLVTESRQVGAALGVAVLGAILTLVETAQRQTLLASVDASLSHAGRRVLDSILAEGQSGQSRLAELSPATAAEVHRAATASFEAGFQAAMLTAAGVALVAALVAAVLIRDEPRPASA